jgi:hypothetical protein
MSRFEQFLADLKSRFSSSRQPKTGRKNDRYRPRLEVLEDRVVPSTIRWVNRGNGDGFTGLFGTALIDTNNNGTPDTPRDTVARRVVDAAIDAWERVIEDFNYSEGNYIYKLTVNISQNGSGFRASAGPTATDSVTGAPTAGSMTISRGLDGPDSNADWVDTDGDGTPDPRGDGIGWFLDPTPNDNSEFQGTIVNAYTGNAQNGSPARSTVDLNGDGTVDPLFDLFTPVAHELGHALGFLDSPQVTALSRRAAQVDTVDGRTGADTDGDGVGNGPFAGLWVFNGPSIQHVLTGFNGGVLPRPGATDRGAPVHSAPAGANAYYLDSADNIVTYNGATDLMTPRFASHQRKLVPYTAALILKDAYGYTVRNPAEFGTFYAMLNQSTGELLVRGGTGVSDDVIEISEYGGVITVSVDVGDDVPGTGRFPGDEDLPAFVSTFDRFSPQVRSIRVESDDGDDHILIRKLLSSTPATINANDGDDEIVIGDGNYMVNIKGAIIVNGDNGADVLTINDRDDRAGITQMSIPGSTELQPFSIQDTYTFTSDTFGKRTTSGFFEPTDAYDAPTLRFHSMSEVTLDASGTTGTEFAHGFASTINIASVATATTLHVNGRAGKDEIIVSNESRDLDSIRGRVDVSGGSSYDVLTLMDQDGDGFAGGLPLTFTTSLVSRSISRVGSFAGVEYAGVDKLIFRASSAADVLHIESTSPQRALEIFGNGGEDHIVFSPEAENLDNIRGHVTIHGGQADDEVVFNDRSGVGINAPPYTITSSQVTRPVLPDNVPFGKFAGVTYDGMQSLIFSASSLPDIILVESTAGTAVEIRGNEGADQIYLAHASKRLDDIQGQVTVQGGDSFDQVILNDQNGIPSAALPYTFRNGLVGRPILPPEVGYGQFGGLAYDDELEKLAFQASEGPDILVVENTSATTALDLRGNGGGDQFIVQSPPSSVITIHGGEPTSSPGDLLVVRGIGEATDGVYVNDQDDPSGGTISMNDQEVIGFNGLESVIAANFGTFTFVSAGSHDDILVDSPSTNRTRVAGTSDDIDFADLAFLDIPEVILDLARNNGPNPHDRVVVQPDSLRARGLQRLTILVGEDDPDVTILDESVPVSVTRPRRAPQFDIAGRALGDWWVATSTGTNFSNQLSGAWSNAVEWVDVQVADVNGDGLDDLVGRAGGDWWVARSTGSAFVNELWGHWSNAVTWVDVQVADVDGDGKDDLVGRAGGDWWVARSTGSAFVNELWGHWSNAVTWVDVQVADVDGDGKEDIVGRTSGNWWVARSTGSSFANEPWGGWSNAVTWVDVQVADVDGDRKDDIVGRAGGDWWVARSTGSGFANELWGHWSNAVSWVDVQVADVDGDGKDDIVGRAGGDWWVAHSTGSGFANELWGHWSNAVTWVDVQVADVDGDGLDDIVGRTGGDWWVARSTGSGFTNEPWGHWSNAVPWVDVLAGNFFDASPQNLETSSVATDSARGETLSHEELAPIVEEAIDILAATGLSEAQVQHLQQVQFQIANLPSNLVGQAWGNTITLDNDAAGVGYFVDLTPDADEEFYPIKRVPQEPLVGDTSALDAAFLDLHGEELLARDEGPAAGRVDLLTVVLHELAHILGREHEADGLLAASLAAGVRYLP